MADNNVVVGLELDDSEFTRDLADASSLADKLRENLSKAGEAAGESASQAGELKDAIQESALHIVELLGLMEGLKKAFEFLSESVGDASKADDALQGLAEALSRVTQDSNEAFAGMQEFAEELSATTGLTQPAIDSALSLALSYGRTADEAKQIVAVATDMAAALGTTVNEEVTKLSGTMNGHIGKLGMLSGALKDLTDDELKAGFAVDALGEQFAGAAAGKLDTFSGTITQIGNAFEELRTAFGRVVTESAPIRAVLNEVKGIFDDLTKAVNSNQVEIQQLIAQSLLNLVKTLQDLIPVFDALFSAFNPFKSDDPFKSMQSSADTFKEGLTAIKDVATDVAGVILSLKVDFLEVQELALKAKEEAQDLVSGGTKGSPAGVGLPGGPAADPLLVSLAETRTEITKTLQQMADLANRTTEIATQDGPKSAADTGFTGDSAEGIAPTGKMTGLSGKLSEALGKLTDQLQGMVDGTKPLLLKPGDKTHGLVPIGTAEDNIDHPEHVATDEEDETAGRGQVAGALGAIGGTLGGAGSATKAVTDVANGFIATFVPEFSGAMAPIISALAQGPQYIRQQVEAFVQALPQVLTNVAQAIPALIDEIAKNVGPIIEALAKAAPSITVALLTAFAKPEFYVEVAKGLAQAVKDGFTENLPQFNRAMQVAGSDIMTAGRNTGQFLNTAGEQFSVFMNKARMDFLALPQTISQALTDGVKSFVAGFADLVNFFKGLPGDLQKSFDKLVQSMQDAFNKLPQLMANLGKEFENGVKSAVAEFASGITDAWKDFSRGVVTAAQEFLNQVTGKGSGGGKGELASLGGQASSGLKSLVPGLATGAFVTGSGTGDSVPAMLAPGELVVDRTTGPRLNAFMDSFSQGGGSDSGTSAVLLARILEAVSQPVNVKTTATVNGKAMADIILQLNRTKARTA